MGYLIQIKFIFQRETHNSTSIWLTRSFRFSFWMIRFIGSPFLSLGTREMLSPPIFLKWVAYIHKRVQLRQSQILFLKQLQFASNSETIFEPVAEKSQFCLYESLVVTPPGRVVYVSPCVLGILTSNSRVRGLRRSNLRIGGGSLRAPPLPFLTISKNSIRKFRTTTK